MLVFLDTAIGTVLVLAAVLKLVTRTNLGPYLMAVGFGKRTAVAIQRVAAPIELVVGAVLIAGLASFSARLVAFLLVLVFILIQLQARRVEVTTECACFALLDDAQSSRWPLVRASMLMALVASAISLDTVGSGRYPSGAVASALLGVASGCAFVLVFALLAQVHRFEQRRPRPIPEPTLRMT
mgnify:CR=1 FL=1